MSVAYVCAAAVALGIGLITGDIYGSAVYSCIFTVLIFLGLFLLIARRMMKIPRDEDE